MLLSLPKALHTAGKQIESSINLVWNRVNQAQPFKVQSASDFNSNFNIEQLSQALNLSPDDPRLAQIEQLFQMANEMNPSLKAFQKPTQSQPSSNEPIQHRFANCTFKQPKMLPRGNPLEVANSLFQCD